MIKKLLITACATLCCSFLYGKQDWKIVWNDEFDYSGTPDNSKWSFDTEGNNWNWGNDEAQNYTPADKKNAWVEDGNLIIEARKEQYQWYGDGETKQYTSARLRTLGKGDWTYGKVEVKALLPSGRGMWPAIWMLPSEEKYGGWPSSGELDIMENVGHDPLSIHCNIHTEAYNHKMGTNKGNTVTTTDPHQNWHIYSMEWDAEKVIFFLDGEQVFRFDNEHKTYKEWPYDQKFHLLLNIAVGGGWGGEQGIDDGIFPQRMLVDYVRVYEYGEVAEEPVDGVLTLNTSVTESICSGDNAVITLDTTGTGRLLHPENLKIEVKNNGENISLQNAQIDENGLINVYVQPETTSTYDIKVSYQEQTAEKQETVTVYENPVIASVDSIGANKVKVVMEGAYGTAPYKYAIDRDMYGDSDVFELAVGSHFVSAIDANGCNSGLFKFTVNESTSVDNIAVSNIAVYANGHNIQIVGAVDGTSFRLLDAKGICMMDGKISGDGIIIASSLDNGIYYIMIEGKAYPIIKK